MFTHVCVCLFLSLQFGCWPVGWPLSRSDGGVVLHLGALNESLLRPGDLYLCIKTTTTEPSSPPQLCAVWRKTDSSADITYQPLEPDKHPLTPLALDMLAEELPTLLQNLLVSVEHAIFRVPFDELTTFAANAAAATVDSAEQTTKPSPLSPRCSIKRRDVITKSNYRRGNLTPPHNAPSAAALDPTSMPLFCLGGSFPHIDSDEESAEDGNNSQCDHNETGELWSFS